MKIFCNKCNNRLAVWRYIPGEDNDCFCDICVPRGCSCNIMHEDKLDINGDLVPLLGKDGYYLEDTDNMGRLLPCCEYDYEQFGIDEFDEDDYYKLMDWFNKNDKEGIK